MKHYDNIVVGSGASGLSMALLLAMNGRKVLLLEKGFYLGGSLTRFRRKGIPFDVGFHFTGGFTPGGILDEMLVALGIREQIEPIFLTQPEANRYVFEQDKKAYNIPGGVEGFKQALKDYFPEEHAAIDRYFELSEKCYRETLSLDLRRLAQTPNVLDEDYKSLAEVMDSLTKNEHLKGILATYCMCYGVKPSEVSFANHARVAYGLYEAVVRVKEGGDAFVKAFKQALTDLGVDVRLKTYITECADVENRRVGKFILNTGEEVTTDECIFTIHPESILKTLPKEHLTKAFTDRVADFEPSLGFFSLYCVLNDGNDEPLMPQITSLLPEPDVDKLLDAANPDETAVVVLTSNEEVKGKLCKIVTALEPSFYHEVEDWKDTSLKKRPQTYLEYKQERTEKILKRIVDFYPEYENKLEVIDAASQLSYRDFLHTPDGSAYGVKQKMGQINLFGRLPFRNLYASGQSSVLPGIVGAMMSSFILLRALLGKEKYETFIRTRLPVCSK